MNTNRPTYTYKTATLTARGLVVHVTKTFRTEPLPAGVGVPVDTGNYKAVVMTCFGDVLSTIHGAAPTQRTEADLARDTLADYTRDQAVYA